MRDSGECAVELSSRSSTLITHQSDVAQTWRDTTTLFRHSERESLQGWQHVCSSGSKADCAVSLIQRLRLPFATSLTPFNLSQCKPTHALTIEAHAASFTGIKVMGLTSLRHRWRACDSAPTWRSITVRSAQRNIDTGRALIHRQIREDERNEEKRRKDGNAGANPHLRGIN